MDKEMKVGLSIFGAMLMLFFGAIVIEAKLESDTYNRLTGSNTTWWDALWVELRVMDAPISKERKP